MASKDPQTVTIYGRVSWPVWEIDKAIERNLKSKYPQPQDKISAEFNLLVEPPQLKKLIDHITNEFLPFTAANKKAGQAKNALTDAEVARIQKLLDSADWDDQPPYIPIKTVPEATAELAPEAAAMIKIKGPQGADIILKAIAYNEDELKVPDPEIISFPVVKPLHQTVHQMYGGAYVAATLNLYAFINGKLPGISAQASTAVFKADGDRFGGGTAIDEDEIFLD